MSIKESSVDFDYIQLNEEDFIEYNLYSIPFITREALVYRVKHRLIILNFMDFGVDPMRQEFNQPFKLVSNSNWIVKDLRIDMKNIVDIIHDNIHT